VTRYNTPTRSHETSLCNLFMTGILVLHFDHWIFIILTLAFEAHGIRRWIFPATQVLALWMEFVNGKRNEVGWWKRLSIGVCEVERLEFSLSNGGLCQKSVYVFTRLRMITYVIDWSSLEQVQHQERVGWLYPPNERKTREEKKPRWY
jgi:hypothetical protein